MSDGVRLRVALVSSSYDPYVGGVESHVRAVARELRELGDEVEVWTVDRGEHLGQRRLDDTVVRYLPTPMPARTPGAMAGFAMALPAAWRRWSAARRAFRPDVLHVQCFGPNGVYATALARRTGTPLVVSSHGETIADDHDAFGGSALLRAGLRRALGQAEAATGCSDLVLDDLRHRFGLSGGVVVPNGVTSPATPDAPTRATADRGQVTADGGLPGLPPAPRRIVFAVGRLEHTKGFDLLLRAYASLPAERDVELVIGGIGSRRAELERLAAELGVAERVHFTGRLDERDVDAWMRRAAVVAVPSRREAFGIVVLEAWRAGAPLVATTLGGPASLVTDGVDGLLVDPTDVDALASALDAVLVDPARSATLAAAGRVSVRRFTWAATARAYARLYDEIRQGRRAAASLGA